MEQNNIEQGTRNDEQGSEVYQLHNSTFLVPCSLLSITYSASSFSFNPFIRSSASATTSHMIVIKEPFLALL